MRGGEGEGEGGTDLHAKIRVRHSSIDGKFSEWPSTIFSHGVEDGFGLEASRFQRGARNVAFLRVGCDADFLAVSFEFSGKDGMGEDLQIVPRASSYQ